MKTKKELIEEVEKCHKLIDFYLGRDWDILSKEELIDRLEKSRKRIDILTKIIIFISIILLCSSTFIIGLMW